MDDTIAWCSDRTKARAIVAAVQDFAATVLQIELRSPVIQRSDRGLSFLGFRVHAGALHAAARRRLEQAHAAGTIDARELQAGYDAALASLAHADVGAFRAANLRRRPPLDA